MARITYKELEELLYEVMKEQNVSGNVGFFSSPKAFSSAVRGWKKASRPKRPSHTKCFDYLEENKKNNESNK